MQHVRALILFFVMVFLCTSSAMAGTISGRLTNIQNQPIAGYRVTAYSSKQMGGDNPIKSVTTASDGNYTLDGIPDGFAYIQAAGASASNNYQWMYWNGNGQTGSTNYNDSVAVPVSSSTPATNINMTLLAGGTVKATFKGTGGVAVNNIGLLLYPGAACNTQNLPSYPATQDSNVVTAYGVPPGTVYAKPWTRDSSLSYILPWWAGENGTVNCSSAQGISVSANVESDITFALVPGGTIAGKVMDPSGSNPLPNMSVYAFTGSPCGQTTNVASSYTNSTGDYSLVVPAGANYYIKAYDYNSGLYIPLWGDGLSGSFSCSSAVSVLATSGAPVAGTTFSMQLGGAISGTVKDASANLLSGIAVQAYDAQGYYISQATTGSNGIYTITGVPFGYALIYANGTANSQSFVRKWWDGGVGDLNRYRATGVSVTTTTPVSGVNFDLEAGGTVTGTITDHNGLPLSGISIRAYAEAPMNSIGSYTSTTTDSNGFYTLKGVPGQVFIEANGASSGINAVPAWWTGSGGAFGPANARPQAVTPASTVSNRNMQLAQGGTITGKITDSNLTGLSGMGVMAAVETDCSMAQAATATTDANGVYTLVGIPTGKAHVSGSGGNYVPMWKSATGATANSQDSQVIPVVAGQTVSGINMPLSLGGTITGTVLGSDTKPLYGVIVTTTNQTCPTTALSLGASTSSYVDGTYTLRGVPVGMAHVKTNPTLRRSDHAVTWYNGNGSSGSASCSASQTVSVTTATPASGVSLTMPHGEIIRGTLTKAGNVGLSCISVWAKAASACADGTYITTGLSLYDGTYALYGLPAGSAYVGTMAAATNQRFLDQYWNGTKGVSTCSQAVGIPTSSGGVLNNVNMTLPIKASPIPVTTLLMNSQ